MKHEITQFLLGGRAAGAPYGKTQEWWPPPTASDLEDESALIFQ